MAARPWAPHTQRHPVAKGCKQLWKKNAEVYDIGQAARRGLGSVEGVHLCRSEGTYWEEGGKGGRPEMEGSSW